jgi:hypothetical protein
VEEARLRLCTWGAFLLIHLLSVAWVSSREILFLVAGGHTSLPEWMQKCAEQAESAKAAGLGSGAALSSRLSRVLIAYEHAAGIESGYGFFAPAVPNSYKLVFQITYDDGHVEYELPHVNDEAAGLRVSSLLEQIGAVRYDPLRELILKMLAYASWQEHPTACKIRAVFGFVRIPSLAEFRRGETESYHFMYAYDFTFAAQETRPR